VPFMFHRILRVLGKPRTHTIKHSDGKPQVGHVTWHCGCRVDYIDRPAGSLEQTRSMQLSPCDWHDQTNMSGIAFVPAKTPG